MKERINAAKGSPDKQPIPQDEPTDLELAVGRRFFSRGWLAQVDFWEGVKEFILKRVKSSGSVDQLY